MDLSRMLARRTRSMIARLIRRSAEGEIIMSTQLVQTGPSKADSRQALRLVAPHVEHRRFDREYWLAHCEGYRVDGGEGRIGFVDRVTDADGRLVLAIRAGRLGRRIFLVPGEAVAFIVPRAQRLWLSAPATIVGSEP